MIQDSQLWNGFAIFCHNFRLFPPNHKVTWFLPENPTSVIFTPKNMNPTSLWRSGWAMVFFQIWLFPPPQKKNGNLKESSVCFGMPVTPPRMKKSPKGYTDCTQLLGISNLSDSFSTIASWVFFSNSFFLQSKIAPHPHLYQGCFNFSLINSKTLSKLSVLGSCFCLSSRLQNFFNTEFNTFTVDYHWIRREHAEKKSYPGFKTRGSFFVPYFEWKIFLWPLL